jgi:tRNA dimethylallyltransferase
MNKVNMNYANMNNDVKSELPALDSPALDCPVLDCWFLTGPTASGKTGVGIELARRLDAEIISLDSMALYRGMDIGTAKPSTEQQAAAVHHMLDVIGPAEEYSVARYLERAHSLIEDVRGRGHEVLFVGGTPLYLKSLLRGLFEGPPADWDFRRQVEDELRTVGHDALYQRLKQVDPVSAAKIHPNDTRRQIRALEVYKATGQPISHLQLQHEEGRPAESCRVFVLQRPREELHQRIDRRVDDMFTAGLVDEVRGLTQNGHSLGQTARQAVGYCEVLEHLAGRRDVEETRQRVKSRTRRFAKRQLTWFRSLSECRDVPVCGDTPPTDIAESVLQQGQMV